MSAMPDQLTIPLRDCTPWCEDGDRHPNEHPGDRSCWSTYRMVGLSGARPVKVGGEWVCDWMNVYLRRLADEDRTLVYLHTEADDREVPLTLGEARTLRNTLDALLALSDDEAASE